MLIGGCGFRAKKKKDKNKTKKLTKQKTKKKMKKKMKQHSPGKCTHFVTDKMKM